MNGVRGIGGAGGAGRVQAQPVKRSERFNVAGPATMAEPVAIASAINGLIGLQDEAAPARRDLAARRGGEAVLRGLSSLQTALLGNDASAALAALRETVAQLPQAADPRLSGIIASIRLRASIELTRHAGSMKNR